MIKSISINGKTVSPGVLTIQEGSNSESGVSVERSSNSLVFRAGTSEFMDNKYTSYLKDLMLNGKKNLPYVASVAGVYPNQWHNIWVLGGQTAQVDLGEGPGTLTICDMSQTVDYPRIYKSVYGMLRQLRLWIDAHKDSLILRDNRASVQWQNMLYSTDDWYVPETSPDTRPIFQETRLRNDISAIGPAVGLLNEYLGIIHFWNYAVGIPESSISVRLHPADYAGLYIGFNIDLPVTSKEEINIEVKISASFTGQTGDNLYIWSRVPVARVLPLGLGSVTYELSGEASPESNTASILDDGVQVQGTSISGVLSINIPEEDVRVSHTIQCVLEVIPFYLCSDSEKTYADSKRAIREDTTGENVWTISATIDGDTTITKTKNTAYAAECVKADESSSEIKDA